MWYLDPPLLSFALCEENKLGVSTLHPDRQAARTFSLPPFDDSAAFVDCSALPAYAAYVLLVNTQYLDDPLLKPLEDDDYVAFGLACCFVMNDNLKLDGEWVRSFDFWGRFRSAFFLFGEYRGSRG